MNKPQPYEQKIFSISWKKFSCSSANKIDSASRYLKLCFILAAEKRLQTAIRRACRLGVYAFPPCATHHPNLALERSALEKLVLFSQLKSLLSLILLNIISFTRKKDSSFSDVCTFPCEG